MKYNPIPKDCLGKGRDHYEIERGTDEENGGFFFPEEKLEC